MPSIESWNVRLRAETTAEAIPTSPAGYSLAATAQKMKPASAVESDESEM